jgi:hypothetical protein
MKGLIPMTKAKRVHSTPRITASKNRVKPAAKPEQRDTHHGKAFRDLESPIHDLYCMAEIVEEVAVGAHKDQDEMRDFAIYRLSEMVRDLRTKYRTDLQGGKAVVS